MSVNVISWPESPLNLPLPEVVASCLSSLSSPNHNCGCMQPKPSQFCSCTLSWNSTTPKMSITGHRHFHGTRISIQTAHFQVLENAIFSVLLSRWARYTELPNTTSRPRVLKVLIKALYQNLYLSLPVWEKIESVPLNEGRMICSSTRDLNILVATLNHSKWVVKWTFLSIFLGTSALLQQIHDLFLGLDQGLPHLTHHWSWPGLPSPNRPLSQNCYSSLIETASADLVPLNILDLALAFTSVESVSFHRWPLFSQWSRDVTTWLHMVFLEYT